MGGLLYGFSPFVLSSLEFAHLMTAALMLLPLILAVLDEILIRQRHSALVAGRAPRRAALRGSSSSPPSCWPSWRWSWSSLRRRLVVAALVGDRAALRPAGAARRRAWSSALGAGAVLLAWPVWFALAGPAHLSGLVWPNIAKHRGFLPSSFVKTAYPTQTVIFVALGGYAGAPLASAAYLGWSFLP